jgi:hypothetical protein
MAVSIIGSMNPLTIEPIAHKRAIERPLPRQARMKRNLSRPEFV